MPNTEYNQQREKSFETLKSALISLLFVIAAWQYNAQQKIEERLYTISSTTMSEAKGAALEERISRNIDSRFSDLSNRLDLILKIIQNSNDKR